MKLQSVRRQNEQPQTIRLSLDLWTPTANQSCKPGASTRQQLVIRKVFNAVNVCLSSLSSLHVCQLNQHQKNNWFLFLSVSSCLLSQAQTKRWFSPPTSSNNKQTSAVSGRWRRSGYAFIYVFCLLVLFAENRPHPRLRWRDGTTQLPAGPNTGNMRRPSRASWWVSERGTGPLIMTTAVARSRSKALIVLL